jgi:hypothetical protein
MTAATPRLTLPGGASTLITAAESLAARARSAAEIGEAVNAVRTALGSRTIRDLTNRIDASGSPTVSKSTVARLCNGQALPNSADAVVSVLVACGYRGDLRLWTTAWGRVRRFQRQERRTATRTNNDSADMQPDTSAASASPVQADTSGYGPTEKVNLAGPDNDVVLQIGIGSWQGDLTRAQLRRALPALLAAGLIVTDMNNSRTAVVLGGAALAMAVGLALVDLGTQERVPIPSLDAQQQFQAALDAIDPDIVHGKLDKAVGRARNVCQVWKTCRDRTSYMAAVAARFSSPRRPSGWDEITVARIADAIAKFIQPQVISEPPDHRGQLRWVT